MKRCSRQHLCVVLHVLMQVVYVCIQLQVGQHLRTVSTNRVVLAWPQMRRNLCEHPAAATVFKQGATQKNVHMYVPVSCCAGFEADPPPPPLHGQESGEGRCWLGP